MIQGMLFRVMANEDDWKKAVAQLGKDLRTKVSSPGIPVVPQW